MRILTAMCGRYTLTTPPQVLAEYFGLDTVPTHLVPRRNIAPTQPVAVVRALPDGTRHLDLVRWGLIPSWAKDARIGTRLINARAESAAQKPAFRAALRHRRCLVPADGFYEWRKAGSRKQPYWVGFEGRAPFAFAGLWEHWEDRDAGHVLESCAILTTDANALVRRLHDRMPVILPPDAWSAWLDPRNEDTAALARLLAPCPEHGMIAYPVSRAVNNPRNEAPDLLEPVAPDAAGE